MSRPFTAHWEMLTTYLRPQRRWVVVLGVTLLSSIGLQLLSPQIVSHFIDATQSHATQAQLTTSAVLYMLVAIGQRLTALGTVYVGENVSWTATNALRADLTRQCLNLDLPFHQTYTPGTLIERIDGDVTALSNFFSEFTIRVLGNSLLVLGILVVLSYDSLPLGAALSVYVLLVLFALRVVQRVTVGAWTASRQADAELYGYLEERVSGTEDIVANGGEGYVLIRLYRLLHARLFRGRRARLIGNLTNISTNTLSLAGYILGLALASALYLNGDASIGTAYTIVFYIGMLAAPLENIRAQIQDLQQATASLSRIDELLQLTPAVQDPAECVPLSAGALGVEFADVSFGYESLHDILHDLSFRLEIGKVLGLLGRTGSGKTTLTRLLFRLYDPQSGTISLSGTDLRACALANVRARVGMVTQDVQLFEASVRDNLTFFSPGYPDERLLEVLKQVGLTAWFDALPSGLNTQLGVAGAGVSAGEAQLLAFARTFLKDPGLVILDEASSRLDPVTERLVEHAVDSLLADRTGIVIAHHLRTVQRAEMIMVLEDGQIVEYGSRLALAADPNSRFASLLRTGLEEVLT